MHDFCQRQRDTGRGASSLPCSADTKGFSSLWSTDLYPIGLQYEIDFCLQLVKQKEGKRDHQTDEEACMPMHVHIMGDTDEAVEVRATRLYDPHSTRGLHRRRSLWRVRDSSGGTDVDCATTVERTCFCSALLLLWNRCWIRCILPMKSLNGGASSSWPLSMV